MNKDSNAPSDPADQEQLVSRHPRHQDPTRNDTERTSDASTIDNGRFGAGPDDPVMPGDEPTLKTNI